MEKVKYGIVGLGNMGRAHRENIIKAFFAERLPLEEIDWIIYSGNREAWQELTDEFVEFAARWTGGTN